VIVLRGGKGLDSIIGVKKCDGLDWVIFIAYSLIVTIFIFIGNKVVLAEQRLKERCHWEYHPDEKIFNKAFITKGNFFGIITGIVASMVGIGGGMITNPILMSQDFIPQVVSFTGMYLIVMNKIVSSTVFILSGLMPIDYLLFTGVILAIGVVIVEWKVAQVVKKFGRQSIISFLFVGIMSVALVLVLLVGFQTTKETLDNGDSLFGFKSYCEDS
jgi:uncharacterized membrane protein YfcA